MLRHHDDHASSMSDDNAPMASQPHVQRHPATSSRGSQCLLLWLLFVSLLLSSTIHAAEFDPYQLNGGLLTAVAGSDYVLLATDTRLIGSTGYDILERDHVRSRLWSATPVPEQNDDDTTLFGQDGSLPAPPVSTTTVSSRSLTAPPVLLASAGCQTDCEMLKRVLRHQVQQSLYAGELPVVRTSGETRTTDIPAIAPLSIAVLLSQTLYERRGFPWYAFCLVAGLDVVGDADATTPTTTTNGGGGGGQVFGYDAIGSYEAVAVATAGTGNHLLQPILDRAFTKEEQPKTTNDNANTVADSYYQPHGIVVPAFPRVHETAAEAAAILIRAYRAVSEREASVGDSLVLTCVQRKGSSYHCWTQSSPLKIH